MKYVNRCNVQPYNSTYFSGSNGSSTSNHHRRVSRDKGESERDIHGVYVYSPQSHQKTQERNEAKVIPNV